MKLRFEGKCRKCGDCCSSVKVSFMVNEDGVCQFLTEDKLCAIQGRTMVPTDEQLGYWVTNCDNYPQMMMAQDATRVVEFLKKIGWPTERCGYTLKVFEDG